MRTTPTLKCLEVKYWEGWGWFSFFPFCFVYYYSTEDTISFFFFLIHLTKNHHSFQRSPLLELKPLLVLRLPGWKGNCRGFQWDCTTSWDQSEVVMLGLLVMLLSSDFGKPRPI